MGCAKKMVFSMRAFSCVAESPRRPSRTCFQQHLPKEARIFVPWDASRTCVRSRPIQLSFAQALRGIFGFFAAMSTKQSQQVKTRPCSSPMPAHVAGCLQTEKHRQRLQAETHQQQRQAEKHRQHLQAEQRRRLSEEHGENAGASATERWQGAAHCWRAAPPAE